MTYEQEASELKAYMEDGLIAQEGRPSAIAQTGEPYEVLGLGIALTIADFDDGKTVDDLLPTLLEEFKKAYARYKADHPGTHLYWRRQPTIQEEGDFDTDSKRIKVIARLLITDKSPIVDLQDAELAH